MDAGLDKLLARSVEGYNFYLPASRKRTSVQTWTVQEAIFRFTGSTDLRSRAQRTRHHMAMNSKGAGEGAGRGLSGGQERPLLHPERRNKEREGLQQYGRRPSVSVYVPDLAVLEDRNPAVHKLKVEVVPLHGPGQQAIRTWWGFGEAAEATRVEQGTLEPVPPAEPERGCKRRSNSWCRRFCSRRCSTGWAFPGRP